MGTMILLFTDDKTFARLFVQVSAKFYADICWVLYPNGYYGLQC